MKKINLTKRALIGGSIALAILTPSIMAVGNNETEYNIQRTTTEEKNEKATTTDGVQILEMDLGYGDEHTNTYTIDDARVIRDGNVVTSNYEISITSQIYDGGAIVSPQIDVEYYNKGDDPSSATSTSSLTHLKYIPKEIINEGKHSIMKWMIAGGNLVDNYDDTTLTQTIDGNEGMYFGLASYYSNSDFLIDPVILHLTWDESRNNGEKVSKSALYFDELTERSASIRYRQKSTSKNAWGTNSDFGPHSIENVAANGVMTFKNSDGESQKYLTTYDGYFYSYWFESSMNTITNDASFMEFDFSDEAIDKFIEKSFKESIWSDEVYWDLPNVHFWTTIEIDETVWPTIYSDWDAGNTIDLEYGDITDYSEARNEEYNNMLEHAKISSRIKGIVEEDDTLYFVESVRFNEPSGYKTELNESRLAFKEIASLIGGNNFIQFMENADVTLQSAGEYTIKDEYEGWYNYQSVVFNYLNIKDRPGFISSTQFTLLGFSFLSIIGLVFVLVILIKSFAKEDSEIEIITSKEGEE